MSLWIERFRTESIANAKLDMQIKEFNVNDRWLSVMEISEYLGITKDSVYKWVKEKGMPAHRLGKLWKFKTDEVDIWMRKGGANEAKSESKTKRKS